MGIPVLSVNRGILLNWDDLYFSDRNTLEFDPCAQQGSQGVSRGPKCLKLPKLASKLNVQS